MRSVSEASCSKTGSRADRRAAGMCSGALLWKLLAGHLGKRAPKDLTAPRTWFTSCVRVLTSASRERIMARCAWEPSPPVPEWVQELRIHSCQAGEVLGVYLVGLSLVGVDEPQLAGVGNQHLVATLLE